jgi:hypothetical protein
MGRLIRVLGPFDGSFFEEALAGRWQNNKNIHLYRISIYCFGAPQQVSLIDLL